MIYHLPRDKKYEDDLSYHPLRLLSTERYFVYKCPEEGEKTILQSNNMVALRVSLLYLGMVWYDNIKDDIRDDIYQRSTKYVHIPTIFPILFFLSHISL